MRVDLSDLQPPLRVGHCLGCFEMNVKLGIFMCLVIDAENVS